MFTKKVNNRKNIFTNFSFSIQTVNSLKWEDVEALRIVKLNEQGKLQFFNQLLSLTDFCRFSNAKPKQKKVK